MGTPFLISRTSPTTLSIAAAKRLGVTVIGYVRRNSFNVYTHPERLLPHEMPPVEPLPMPAAIPPAREAE
jgi:FdhD protein